MSEEIQEQELSLSDLFTKEHIKHFKNNKELITSELLETLRSFGNEGKQVALDILDIEKDHENYYLDAFGNRISFNGNRRVKKAFTKLALYPIHYEELQKCAADIHYYKDNYVKIRTKSGVNFPEVRQYQNDFIQLLSDDDEEGIVGLMGRQSSKSISTSIYLSHLYIYDTEKNIGIVANKGTLAREFLSNVKNILIELPIWMQPGMKTWNKSFIEAENEMRILTDVPSENAFRGFSIHCAVIDEAAFIRTNRWSEFIDAFLPSQAALSWKKNIILSTAKGMNHFYDIVKGASPEEYHTDGSGIKKRGTSGYTLFKVDWRDVPRYDSKGNRMKPEEFRDKIINKHGILYWNQNFASEFLGSSATLISSEKLKTMNSREPEEIRDGKLKIYKYPEKDHKYLFTIDPSKDGIDAFACQITDITNFTFEQVASAQLQIDYLLMPEYINDWGVYYNNAYLIIENNEGAGQSIADQMVQTYEYENIHYDKDVVGKNKKKKYPGFRTTAKSRKQILQTLKLFIENDNIIINDRSTISEFFQFILINNKYQADEGCHDDMIMSLALTFVPFLNSKNFEDMKEVIEGLYNKEFGDSEESKAFSDYMTIGSFDDGTDIGVENKNIYMYNGYQVEVEDGFY